MSQPPGFHDLFNHTHVCKLHKALYVLKQSSRAWYNKLKDTLIAHGFVSSSSYPSFFIYRQKTDVAYLLVYVDDIVLTGNNSILLNQFITILDQKFTIKDLGDLHYFLGIEVQRHDKGLLLTQSRYIYSILDKAHMQGAKPITTHMATGQPLSKFTGDIFANP
jgi:Reverse transcriptase (RNA-dependent DNA polymerase)